MKNYGDITYRYLKRQWKRAFLTVAGIILSVALITAIGTMVVSLQELLIKQAVNETGDYYVEYSNVKGALVNKIKNYVDVSKAAVIGKEGDAVVSRVSDKERAAIGEVPPYRYLKLRSYDESALQMFPIPLKEGRLPQSPGELLVDYWVLEYLPGQPKLGDRIKLEVGSRYAGNSNIQMEEYKWSRDEVFQKKTEMEFTIVGLTKPRIETSRNYFCNGITFINSQELAQDKNYEAYVKLDSVKGVTEKAEAIAQAVGLEKQKDKNGSLSYQAKYNNKLLRLSAQSENSVFNNALIMILIFIIILVMVCTIAVIYNAFNISVLERISQFGVLRCVGATPGQIRNVVFKEAVILSILGIPAGLVCGVLAMKVVIYVINSLGNNAPVFFKENLQVVVSLPVLVASAVLGLVTVYLSAMGPARQAARISPLEAVKNTGSYKKENFIKARESRIVQFLFGIEGQIAFKNLRRNRRRFRITVFSMAISIVLYIVFGSFVNYIFAAGAVGGVPNADFLLSIKEDGIESFTAEQYEEMKNLPGVERIYKDMCTSVMMGVPEEKINDRFAELKGELLQTKKEGLTIYSKGKLISYGEAAIPDLQKILNKDNLDAMNRENGVILVATSQIYDPVGKKTAIVNAFNYKVGEQILIAADSPGTESANLQFRAVKVVGILEKSFLDNDYNGDGIISLITTDQVYKNIAGSDHYHQVAIKLDKDANREPVAKYLKDFSSKDPSYEYIDISIMMTDMRNVAIRMSIFLYGFVVVVALIGCLNIINTVSTNLILRTRELSVLKAVGMTQNGIKKLVCLEGTLYGIISAVYGGVIGTGLSYLLYRNFVDIREFTWSMPWAHILTAMLGAILVALISGYIPLRRINRGIIIDNIRIEE